MCRLLLVLLLVVGTLPPWWLGDGAGGIDLAMRSIQAATTNHKTWCLVAAKPSVCPLPAFTVSTHSRCLLVRPRTDAEAWWATEQALRSPAVGCTWNWADEIPERVGRRWMVPKSLALYPPRLGLISSA